MSQGKFNAHYRSSTLIEHKQPVPLNPDHTHFIFVDDGYRARYGGVAAFRSKFEKRIAQDAKGTIYICVCVCMHARTRVCIQACVCARLCICVFCFTQFGNKLTDYHNCTRSK